MPPSASNATPAFTPALIPVPSPSTFHPPSLVQISGWCLVAVTALHLAYLWPYASSLSILYLFCLIQIAHAETWRKAFYPGLAVGLLLGILRLEFFWRIFSGGAVALWIVFAFWIGLFVTLARLSFRLTISSASRRIAYLLIPFLWCGLEYSRSELYYLRFAWLSPGFAYGAAASQAPLQWLGTYGIGWMTALIACAAVWAWETSRVKALFILLTGAGLIWLGGLLGSGKQGNSSKSEIPVAGVQMEFPTEPEVLLRLNETARRFPETQLFVLSEYTFSEPIPQKIRNWCKEHHKFLIVGGKDPVSTNQFYNTAFVVSPEGAIAFRQVKRVPIQFFKDGLPAPTQELWFSPWGKIGLCICYDLSYSRVTDRLVKLGAEALIVPTMDVYDWGERQHRLHALVAPVRAAEYRLPVFRLASSGVSQLIDLHGKVTAAAPCPGEGAIITGTLTLRGSGHLPIDRLLAPVSVAITATLLLFLVLKTTFQSLSLVPSSFVGPEI